MVQKILCFFIQKERQFELWKCLRAGVPTSLKRVAQQEVSSGDRAKPICHSITHHSLHYQSKRHSHRHLHHHPTVKAHLNLPPTPSICGKLVSMQNCSPWCQKDWGPLILKAQVMASVLSFGQVMKKMSQYLTLIKYFFRQEPWAKRLWILFFVNLATLDLWFLYFLPGVFTRLGWTTRKSHENWKGRIKTAAGMFRVQAEPQVLMCRSPRIFYSPAGMRWQLSFQIPPAPIESCSLPRSRYVSLCWGNWVFEVEGTRDTYGFSCGV